MGEVVAIKQTVEPVVKADAKKVAKVKQLYGQLEKVYVNALEKAYEIGTLLVEIRKELPAKTFMQYVEDTFDFSYKSAQRWIQISEWKPQIEEYIEVHIDEFETEIELADAQKIARKLEEEEKAGFKEWEEGQFDIYYPKHKKYKKAVDKADTAAEGQKIKAPIKPWADHEEVRNIDNHYEKWVKVKEAPPKKTAPAETVSDEDEDIPDIDEIINSAYASAMSVLERFLSGDSLADARGILSDRFSSEEAPEY